VEKTRFILIIEHLIVNSRVRSQINSFESHIELVAYHVETKPDFNFALNFFHQHKSETGKMREKLTDLSAQKFISVPTFEKLRWI
jgi:hypothetical protein